MGKIDGQLLGLLRSARAGGTDVVAIDRLLELGVSPEKARRACRPYATRITMVGLLLQDQLAAAYRLLPSALRHEALQRTEALLMARDIDRRARPLAAIMSAAEAAAEIAQRELEISEERHLGDVPPRLALIDATELLDQVLAEAPGVLVASPEPRAFDVAVDADPFGQVLALTAAEAIRAVARDLAERRPAGGVVSIMALCALTEEYEQVDVMLEP